MLAMGRALMGRPKLLLLDEPSLGLAPFLVRDIFQIIRDINAQGTTVLLVEQNAHMALGVAHRGYVLETGRIVHGRRRQSAARERRREESVSGRMKRTSLYETHKAAGATMVPFAGWEMPVSYARHSRRSGRRPDAARGSSTSRTWARCASPARGVRLRPVRDHQRRVQTEAGQSAVFTAAE